MTADKGRFGYEAPVSAGVGTWVRASCAALAAAGVLTLAATFVESTPARAQDIMGIARGFLNANGGYYRGGYSHHSGRSHSRHANSHKHEDDDADTNRNQRSGSGTNNSNSNSSASPHTTSSASSAAESNTNSNGGGSGSGSRSEAKASQTPAPDTRGFDDTPSR